MRIKGFPPEIELRLAAVRFLLDAKANASRLGAAIAALAEAPIAEADLLDLRRAANAALLAPADLTLRGALTAALETCHRASLVRIEENRLSCWRRRADCA